jgi:hypothetical protein
MPTSKFDCGDKGNGSNRHVEHCGAQLQIAVKARLIRANRRRRELSLRRRGKSASVPNRAARRRQFCPNNGRTEPI